MLLVEELGMVVWLKVLLMKKVVGSEEIAHKGRWR